MEDTARTWCGYLSRSRDDMNRVAIFRTWPTRLCYYLWPWPSYLLVAIAAVMVQNVTADAGVDRRDSAPDGNSSVTDISSTPLTTGSHRPTTSLSFYTSAHVTLPTLLVNSTHCVPPCHNDTHCIYTNVSQGLQKGCYNCSHICDTLNTVLGNLCNGLCSEFHRIDTVTASTSVLFPNGWTTDHVTMTSYNRSLPPGIVLQPMNLKIRMSLASVGFVIAVITMLALMAVCTRLEKRFGPNQDEEYACILEDAFSVGVDDTVVWDSNWSKEPPDQRPGGSHPQVDSTAGEGTSLRSTAEQGLSLTGAGILNYGTTSSS